MAQLQGQAVSTRKGETEAERYHRWLRSQHQRPNGIRWLEKQQRCQKRMKTRARHSAQE
jgi:hypothetical protein